MRIQLFRTEDGRLPFAEWRARLSDQALARVDVNLRRLSAGNTSHLKSVGDGVLELKIDWGPGYRVYLARSGLDVVLLLAGGTKSRQHRDIAEAKRYWQTYKDAKGSAVYG